MSGGFNKFKRKWNRDSNTETTSLSLDNKKDAGKNSGNNASNASNGPAVAESVFELGKNKRVTVRQFRNVNLIDIREYYKDSSSGELRPGKKGISLTEEMYDSLIRQRRNIEDALRRMGSKRTKNGLLDSIRDQDTKTAESSTKTTPEPTAATDAKRKLDDTDPQAEGTAEKKVKQEVAPPQLLPNEAAKRQEELENTATLVIPGVKKEVKDEGLDSSDEEFAAGLEADIKGN